MILSTHFITGAAVASYTDSPTLLAILTLIIHFLLDLFPHWEYVDDEREIAQKTLHILTDALAGPLVILFFAYLAYGLDFEKIGWIFLGGTISVIPDGFSFLYFTYPKNKFLSKLFDFHQLIHSKKKMSFQEGFVMQVALDALAVILMVYGK